MDSYRIMNTASELIIADVSRRTAEGQSQSEISRLVGCERSTVHRWVTEGFVRENTSFRDMVRYLDRLRIPLSAVFGTKDELPPPSPDRSVTELDKAVSATLVAVAKAVGKDSEGIAREVESLTVPDIDALLKARDPMRTSDFYRICKAIGVSPEVILSRALGISEQPE